MSMIVPQPRIKNMGNNECNQQVSKMSKLVYFLINIPFISLKMDKEHKNVTFKVCSYVTILSAVLYGGMFLFLPIIHPMISKNVTGIIMENYLNRNIIDILSSLDFSWILGIVFPVCPFVLAHAVPSIPVLALAKDLKWPKSGSKLILSGGLAVVGNFVTYFGYWKDISKDKVFGFSEVLIAAYVMPLMQNLLLVIFWMLPFLLGSAWIERFTATCKENNFGNIIKKCRKLPQIFFEHWEWFRILLLLCLFLISVFNNYVPLSNSFPAFWFSFTHMGNTYPIGMMCSSLSLMLNIAAFTFVIDNAYKSVKV
jgi:hypothetical protein